MLLIILAVLLVTVSAAAFLSPVPISLLIRAAFKRNMAVPPDNYESMREKVTVINDLPYPSKHKDNLADLYIPKEKQGPFPVVIWVHGGAFVGGDKRDAESNETALAAQGFAVVSINYQRAPEAKYPTPIFQTQEAYLWLKDIADTYSIDVGRLILAGDSAGAHIVAQFAAIQSNRAYAAEMSMEQTVPLGTLKAVLLYCGPFDVSGIVNSGNKVLSFLMGRTAWAYFGVKKWAEQFSAQATVAHYITPNFPPTFITDGNTASFEWHGRALADVLRENDVPVDTFFVPADTEVTMHEYQFVMNTPAGEESFRRTVDFLLKYA